MSRWLSLWPEQASAHAAELDRLLIWFSILLLFLVLPVFVGIVVLPVIYRRGSSADRTRPPRHNPWLEAAWGAIPLALALYFFFWAARMFHLASQPHPEALEINVLGKQWMWKIIYPTGQEEINTLHVPAAQPVRLILTSQDVIHSFYVPALRMKMDALPARYTYLNFTADRPGTYRLLCNEFCGTDHSRMVGRVVVMSAEDYAEWLDRSGADLSLAEEGGRLFRSLGCSGCHSDRSTVRAPPLEGVFGSPVPLSDGGFVVADEAYIRDSILLPQKHVVAGYPPIMPSFEGQIGEAEIIRLVAYVRSLAAEEGER